MGESESSLALANQVDQVKAFMLYAYFGGDALKCANACRVDIRIIQALEHDFSWADKIKGQNRLDTPEGLKMEQELNRAANYTMAKRFAAVLESVVLDAESTERFIETLCIELVPIKGKPGEYEKVFTAKPLLELAKAMQTINDMSYRALGDKTAAKADTVPDDTGKSTSLAIHIYGALAKMGQAVKVAERMVPQAELGIRGIDAMDAGRGVIIDVPAS